MRRIILASSSPRRRELMNLVGLTPEIIVPRADENRRTDESVETFLERVTVAKGKSVLQEVFFDSLVISSDTIVLLEKRIIGKPRSREEAFSILQFLAGRVHQVCTGISLFYRGRILYDLARTSVYFGPISDEEINYYLDNENYMDKAGAYAIQGKASVFIEKIEGCFFNVMGFPLNLFFQMLKKLGIEIYK